MIGFYAIIIKIIFIWLQNVSISHIMKVYIYTISWAMKKKFFSIHYSLKIKMIYLKEIILKEEKARYTKTLTAVLASLKPIPVC